MLLSMVAIYAMATFLGVMMFGILLKDVIYWTKRYLKHRALPSKDMLLWHLLVVSVVATYFYMYFSSVIDTVGHCEDLIKLRGHC